MIKHNADSNISQTFQAFHSHKYKLMSVFSLDKAIPYQYDKGKPGYI